MQTKGLVPYLQFVRAPAALTAVSNIIAASVIVSGGHLTLDILWLVMASVCFYSAGMALNDCFDYEEDLAQRANRPLPSGQISRFNGWLIGFLLLSCGCLLTYCFNEKSLWLGVTLSGAILLYNGVVKEGWPGSVMMANCRYLNWLLGASFVAFSTSNLLLAAPIFAYIFGLTYLSKQETQAQDKNAVWICTGAIFGTGLLCVYLIHFVFELSLMAKWIAWGLLLIWSGIMLNKLLKVFRDFSPKSIQGMIIFMVIGVIPLDALIVAISGHYLYAVLILALLPPCRMLNKRLNAIT